MKDTNVEISVRTILVVLLVGFLFWLMLLIKSIVMALLLATVLALGFEPLVVLLTSKGFSRGLAVLIVIFGFIALFTGLGIVALPPIISQFRLFGTQFPKYLDTFGAILGTPNFAKQFGDSLVSQLSQTTGDVLSVTIGAFSSVFAVFTIIIFTVYILIYFDEIKSLFVRIFPENQRKEISGLTEEIEIRLGGWLRAEAILMCVVGFMTYIGLTVLGVDGALALAVIAGLLEIVPIIGPIMSMIPALIIGFVMSPITGFAVLGLYILIQQLENNILVPKVMQKTVGVNPLVTIIALLIGGELFGVVGALVAVPITIVISIVAKHLIVGDGDHFTKSPRTAG